MKKNTSIKIFFIILLIVLVIITVPNKIQASSAHETISGADNFLKIGKEAEQPLDPEGMKDTANTIYNILLIAGTVATVIVGMTIGIKFITGSVEQKSKIKEALLPYIVGCIIIFGAFGIWKLVIVLLRQTQ